MADLPKRQVTLDEVAERAGVSRSAASRVINNAPHVSKAKREAVQRAVSDLGYVPNATARALATQQAGAVQHLPGCHADVPAPGEPLTRATRQ